MQITKDTIIIGGGAAGILAGISARKNHPQESVMIIDKTFALGRKILVSGAGRCNITNINLNTHPEKHYYGANAEFIQTVFTQFDFEKIMSFFHEMGIETYIETKNKIGKIFPITNSAKNVVAVLEEELRINNVEINLNTFIKDITKTNDNQFKLIDQDNRIFVCNKLIIAAGGMTYPALGSDGSIYQLLKKFGHNVIKMIPAALPLVSKNKLSHMLQGVKLELEVTSIINHEKIKTSIDDVMFTQYGLSGPAVMNISREFSILFNRNTQKNDTKAEISINFFPELSYQEALEKMQKYWQKRPSILLEKSFYGLWPAKVANAILLALGYNPDQPVYQLSISGQSKLVNQLVDYRIQISGTRGWNEAEFTAGGIDTQEVNPLTLESRIIKNLYFCGEILNVDGDIGGFNLSFAWSSGWISGK